MQSGGGIPPFVQYQPININKASGAEAESSNTSEDDTKGKITDKDLLTMLKDIDGLPSDMQALYENLQSFYELGGADDPLNTASLSTKYIQAIQQIKTAKYHKEVFDKAYDQLKANGGLHEYAITDTGRLVGMNDKGEIKTFTLDEAKSNESYQILTNAQLMQYRAEHAAGQDSLSAIAANGIGMEQVNKLINAFIGKLGTSEQSVEGIIGKEGQIYKGIQILQQAFQNQDAQGQSIEGLYKTKIITKTQAQQAQAALTSVLSMLPENAKTLLKIKGNGEEGALNIIQSIITSGLSDTNDFSSSLLVDANGEKLGSKGKTEGSDKFKMNAAAQFVSGYGQNEDYIIQNGTSNGLHVKTNTLPITTKDGKPLGTGSTLQDISQSQYGGIFDMQNASMGGVMLSDGATMKVLTDGQAHSIDLPLDMEAYQNGDIKPDLKVGKKIEEVEQYIRDNNITDYEQINELYKEKGIPVKYSADGQLNETQWGRFATFAATALNSAFKEDMTFNDGLLEEVIDENETKNYLAQVRKANGWDEKSFKFDEKSWADKYFGGDYDAFYKGQVFVPIKVNMFNALAGSGLDVTPDKALEIKSLQQQKERLQSYKNPGSFNL